MKTDALYLNVFETVPALALRLAGYGDVESVRDYTCHSEELKRSFRVDAIFTPPSKDLPLVLAEVQFWRDNDIYHRIIASYAITRIQQSAEYADVRMVIFFASRKIDTGAGEWEPFVASGLLQVVYLDEITSASFGGIMLEALTPEEQASLLLLRITVSPNDREADTALAAEFGRILRPLKDKNLSENLRNYFVNSYIHKYEDISLSEIMAMIDSIEIFDDIGKSRAVREYAEIQVQKATQKARMESALAMLRAGIPIDQVSNILGIPEAEIESAREAGSSGGL